MAKVELDRLYVWTGGAVFACSLILCAHAFLFRWAQTGGVDARTAARAVPYNAALFTLFAAHHSIFARESIKAWVAQTVPETLVRSLYVWTASLLLILVVMAWQPVGGNLYQATGWTRYVHALVQLAGVSLIVRSVRVIDALDLAGIRATDRPAALQIAGPYRVVRHPLYLGWMLTVFGTAHVTGDRALFAAISTLYVLIAIPWEERSLERAFGEDYSRYRRHVRWRVIPFVY